MTSTFATAIAAPPAGARASSAAALTSVGYLLDGVRERLCLIETLDHRIGVHLLGRGLLRDVGGLGRKNVDRRLPFGIVHQAESLRIVRRVVEPVDDLELFGFQLE